MTEILAAIILIYLTYRLVAWGVDAAIPRMSAGTFGILTGIPKADEWSWDFNVDDTGAQRMALLKAAKDLGVRIKFGRCRGGHWGMAGVFVHRDDAARATRLSDRRYAILAGRWDYTPCAACGGSSDGHYGGCPTLDIRENGT